MTNNLIDAARLYDIVHGAKWIAIDCETTGLHPIIDSPLGMGIVTDKGGGYVPLAPYRTIDSALWEAPPSLAYIKEIMQEAVKSDVLWIGWNLKFDLHMLKQIAGMVPGRKIVDAQVGMWLLNEENSMSLKSAMQSIWKGELEDFKDQLAKAQQVVNDEIDVQREAYAAGAPRGQKLIYRKEATSIFPARQAKFNEIPIEYIAPYCYKDALFTALLWWGYIEPNLNADNLLAYFYSYEMPFLLVLYDMEQGGISIDLSILAELAAEGNIRLNKLEQEIFKVVGRQINPRSHQEMSKYLFEEKDYQRPTKLTKSGASSLDENSLKGLYWTYKKKEPIFKLLLDYRETHKNISTYCEALPKESIRGRIHTRYNQTGTSTGRLSSEKPNLQQLPRKGGVRGAFIASEGMKLIKADLSQAELRVLADRTQDSLLLSVYRSNKDMHQETMERLGITNRVVAKRLNFLVNYGGGPAKFQQLLFFEEEIYRKYEDCQSDLKNFYLTYPGVNIWKERVNKWLDEKHYVETILGRRRHLTGILNADNSLKSYAQRQAQNCLIQGDVADYVKACMINIQDYLKSIGGTIICQVHDEILSEVPEDKAEEAARRIKDEMENLIELSVPMKADVGVGERWNQTKEI